MSTTEHEENSSFIKTPKQLVIVILLAFLVPIIGIILIVHLVTSQRSAIPAALTPEAVAARLQPVGTLEVGAPAAAPGARTGEEIVKAVCSACHLSGVAGAPKIGDKAAWAPRIKQGQATLFQHAIHGLRAMPPKGGDASLTNEEVERAVAFMANKAGAHIKAPAPKAAAVKAQAPAAPSAPAPKAEAPAATSPTQTASAAASNGSSSAPGAGKKVFDSTCHVCHATGVAGAPKLGDKAAWAPRIKQGEETLVKHALGGLRAMPPRGGNSSLSDAQVRAAVEFMVSQSK
jgi:cytochrome c5